MKKIHGNPTFLLLIFFFCCNISFAQMRHTVAKGETVTQIAQKYQVTPYDIYKLNPDAQRGIHENDVLIIPSAAKIQPKAAPSAARPATHIAKAKETLYSISKQYGVTIDQLVEANPFLSQGLKIGQTIKIPGTAGEAVQTPAPATKPASVAKPAETKAEARTGNITYHIVEPKETKFGISKRYGMTIAELEERNPGIEKNLPIGFKLVVSGSGPNEIKPASEKSKSVTDADSKAAYDIQPVKTQKRTAYANYEVKPKETIYSLTQSLGITEAELVALNPTLKDGLKVGMILKVPGTGSIIAEPLDETVDLSKSLSTTQKKRLVLLLPFNTSKITGDSLKSVTERLKKDAFLNMTLDFYAGALVAIDSAKALGLNIDVRIYDSQENKVSSNVTSIVEANDLINANAVIGPFYQQHAERTAELLSANDVPVISPLSKESSHPTLNLFQATPPVDVQKTAMFEFMIAKGGNIIIVADPKRVTNKEFITKNYPLAQFVATDDNGGVNIDNLKSLLVKDRRNYIVLDTEKTGMILSTTNLLLNEMTNYDLQLAILEPNETLDYEEVSMKRLTILKLLYPSMTRENSSDPAMIFENTYKRDNKIFPSQYAVRGFDVTFDTMLRLSQDVPFAGSAQTKSEQIESKFEYVKNETQGYVNKGVYILEYQDDLTVKEAN